MKTLYKNSPRFNIILYIVIALVAIAIVGVIIALTSGGSVQSFYVTIDEKNIMEADYDYILKQDESTNVKMNFLSIDEDNSNYTVTIVPTLNAENDFDFTADGSVYSFQQTPDYTAGFTIKKTDEGFSIQPKGNLESIIEAAVGSDVEELNAKSYDNMFTMIITSADEKSNIYIQFSIYEPVTDVSLDKEAITF
jgi:hypothetical protein